MSLPLISYNCNLILIWTYVGPQGRTLKPLATQSQSHWGDPQPGEPSCWLRRPPRLLLAKLWHSSGWDPCCKVKLDRSRTGKMTSWVAFNHYPITMPPFWFHYPIGSLCQSLSNHCDHRNIRFWWPLWAPGPFEVPWRKGGALGRCSLRPSWTHNWLQPV